MSRKPTTMTSTEYYRSSDDGNSDNGYYHFIPINDCFIELHNEQILFGLASTESDTN
ncbi:MAG: hypothetical protein Q8L97_05080 [Nitrosomonas sp.]|uniref:hypothetical protein n=1 Tax=Nitrosomonas sp. TaxID=42353 RepID=UPI0027304EE9|nr:hypothetical protein [Nitrosomonas sp.]MDP1549518.1 hypothetical protein [Nitrosomonas sp.]